MAAKKKNKWYVAGLHFECTGCGNCCAGPDEGFVWITKPEIDLLAKHLDLSTEETKKKYLRRIVIKYSLIENPKNNDCIFLSKCKEGRGCAVYPVRPNQCRTWPFWSLNLLNANMWNSAAIKCPGINRGKLYTFDEIERLKKQEKWWIDEN